MTSGAAILTIAALTWMRLLRAKALFSALAILALPCALAFFFADKLQSSLGVRGTLEICLSLLAILPSLLVATAVSSELEDKTSAYLWSRPIARWTLVIGKYLVLASVTASSFALAISLTLSRIDASLDGIWLGAALLLAAYAACSLALVISLFFPKQGVWLSASYFFLADMPIGHIPAGIAKLSVTYHARTMILEHDAVSAIALLVIALGVLTLGCWRVRSIE